MISTESNKLEDPLSVDKLDQRDSKERDEPTEQLVSIPLKEDPTRLSKLDRNFLIQSGSN